MRILVDENLPRSLAERLRRAGHDAVDLRELGRAGSADPEVMALANGDRRLLVSANHRHFANITLFPPANTWGLLVVRMPKCAIGAVMARIEEVLGAVEEFHLRGYLTIVEPARIRRRR